MLDGAAKRRLCKCTTLSESLVREVAGETFHNHRIRLFLAAPWRTGVAVTGRGLGPSSRCSISAALGTVLRAYSKNIGRLAS